MRLRAEARAEKRNRRSRMDKLPWAKAGKFFRESLFPAPVDRVRVIISLLTDYVIFIVCVHLITLWETGGFQKALYQHVDMVT